MIQLDIENVGIVKKANIEVDGVTVIAGMNGTGKSTVSKSLFAAINAREDLRGKILRDKEGEISGILRKWIYSDACSYSDKGSFLLWSVTDKLSSTLVSCFLKEMEIDDNTKIDEIRRIISQRCEDREIMIHDFSNICERICEILERNIYVYVEHFVERYFQDVFQKQINFLGSQDIATIHFTQEEDKESSEYFVSMKENCLAEYSGTFQDQSFKAVYIDTKSVLDIFDICQLNVSMTDGSIIPDELDLFKYSIQNAELLWEIRDEKRLTFSEVQQAKSSVAIIKRIIENVTHGKLVENSNSDMEFYDQNINGKIEFSNLSSGLKIFVLVQKLLENYSLRSGDILLVDEPEVNLHPEWQVLLADIFVQMYKELNIRMVINSHSPYFIRAIEVKMAEHECALKGRYYYMRNEGNRCVCDDVTNETNIIYETLYKPLSSL